ncbi:DUF7346 family protein [Haloarcula onubensis]|uniref:MarR family transcriptional regulator n=1 Tax=Haloarcula onubensis TaxID=2950539 RepID=A0ABU2FK89_9EURY|nr:hypothetical protein [Halomicroarcula sp. S3CR25-11]MDS0281157.1 hypothetical protein [Halomicroarcula sp. S3CR25-11]
MRTVRDESGTHYVLLKRSSESSLVRNPETGAERHVANEELTAVDGESPLETAAGAVPDGVRTVLAAVHDDRALGLLLELDRRGPLSVADLLDSYDLCESDLHGLLAEFRAAGLVEPAEVVGQPGYDATATASEAVDVLTD